MAIVKSVRRAGQVAGKVLDAEDRRVLGQGVIIGVTVLAGAGVVGLAWRLFWLAAVGG